MSDSERIPAAARVTKFCDEWERMSGHDHDVVYGLHRGDEREASLTVSDLRVLAAADGVQTQTATTRPVPDAFPAGLSELLREYDLLIRRAQSLRDSIAGLLERAAVSSEET